jgi:hypothetical protein
VPSTPAPTAAEAAGRPSWWGRRLPLVCGLLALLAAGRTPAQAPTWVRAGPAPADRPGEVTAVEEEHQVQPIPTVPPATPITIQPIQAPRVPQPGQPGAAAPGGIPPPKSQETSYYGLLVSELPSKERLFLLDPEPALDERIRQDFRDRNDPTKVVFPPDPVLTRDGYVPRHWPVKYEWAEPDYVCYNRLNFEQPNAERWGWDFGIMQPFISAGWFFADVLVLPYHAFTDPCRCYECSAGYCLPGDPVPYRLYPPGLSATGFLAEAAFVTGLFLIFP